MRLPCAKLSRDGQKWVAGDIFVLETAKSSLSEIAGSQNLLKKLSFL